MTPQYALSVKQPWAALLVHGLKTVEVRRWPTARRGRVLIHAARIADPREEGWQLVTADIESTAELCGGIIGAAELIDCIRYPDAERFGADRERHRNHPDWFLKPCLFGFHFANAQSLPFRRLPGNVRFFSVPAEAEDRG